MRTTMTERLETLSDLLEAAGVGRGGPTFAEFQKRAVDPDSGYRPSTMTIQKLRDGAAVKMNEKLMGAIAAGLGEPIRRIQRAAAWQYLGLPVVGDPFPGDHGDDVEVTVAREPGTNPQELDLTREAVLRVLREIGADLPPSENDK